MDKEAVMKWFRTAAIAAVGGGIAASVAAAFDPQKYNLAHDFGSGKLWTFFFQGAGLTFGALLLKSPLGQKAMKAYRDTQEELKQNQADFEKAKTELKK